MCLPLLLFVIIRVIDIGALLEVIITYGTPHTCSSEVTLEKVLHITVCGSLVHPQVHLVVLG